MTVVKFIAGYLLVVSLLFLILLLLEKAWEGFIAAWDQHHRKTRS